jgi:epoxide hydrolase-like predicted phosphatase
LFAADHLEILMTTRDSVAEALIEPAPPLSALIVDYVGVMTVPIKGAVLEWMLADGLDTTKLPQFMRDLTQRTVLEEGGPIHGLEIGTWTKERFEVFFAKELADAGIGVVPAEGLLGRMALGLRPNLAMADVVARARAAGMRTALLSNAFGFEYPRGGFGDLYDATVISDEVGIRKPDPAIYRMVCERLDVEPAAAVFVDDLEANVVAAAALGMTGVHHVDTDATVAQLERLLALP